MNAPSVAEAFYRLIDERDRLTAENGRLRRAGGNAQVLADELRTEVVRLAAERDALIGFVQEIAEANPCQSSSRGCLETWPHFRGGWCLGCQARRAVAACKDGGEG